MPELDGTQPLAVAASTPVAGGRHGLTHASTPAWYMGPRRSRQAMDWSRVHGPRAATELGGVQPPSLLRGFGRPRGLCRSRKEILDLLGGLEVVPNPAAPASVPIRDPDDPWVLASAIAGRADVLITGDRDLLDIAASAPFPVLSSRGLSEFVRKNI